MKAWDKQEEGSCPKCDSTPLKEGSHKIEDTAMYLDVWCTKCNWKGIAVYSLEFYEYVK